MKHLYLVLAIAGAILPYFFFTQFLITDGFNLPGFISALFANPAASGFTSDLLFSSFVFWIMIYQEKKHRNGPNPLTFIALNLTIGLSCALPAYLYARSPKH